MASLHPLIDSENAALCPLDQILACLAGHTAQGNLDAVCEDWMALSQNEHSAGVEVILQTHLFAGYPRTINALGSIRKLGFSDNASSEAPSSEWRPAGESLCSQIYAGSYDKLRKAISSLHVDLESWMIETGYGRVLSRPGLSPMQREFCVVAVLAGQNVQPQLLSHLRGAIHVGASTEALDCLLILVGKIWDADAEKLGRAILEKLRAK